MPNYTFADPNGRPVTVTSDAPLSPEELDGIIAARVGSQNGTAQNPYVQMVRRGLEAVIPSPLGGRIMSPIAEAAAPSVATLMTGIPRTLGTAARNIGMLAELMPAAPMPLPAQRGPLSIEEFRRAEARSNRTPTQLLNDVEANPLIQSDVGITKAVDQFIPPEQRPMLADLAAGFMEYAPPMLAQRVPVVGQAATPLLFGLDSASRHLVYDRELLRQKHPELPQEEIDKMVVDRAQKSGLSSALVWGLMPPALRQVMNRSFPSLAQGGMQGFISRRLAHQAEMLPTFLAQAGGEQLATGDEQDYGQTALGASLLALATPRGRAPIRTPRPRPPVEAPPPQAAPTPLQQVVAPKPVQGPPALGSMLRTPGERAPIDVEATLRNTWEAASPEDKLRLSDGNQEMAGRRFGDLSERELGVLTRNARIQPEGPMYQGKPTVPGTPAETGRDVDIVTEIARSGARTKAEVQKLFPGISRERAAELLRQSYPAWWRENVPPPRPEIKPTPDTLPTALSEDIESYQEAGGVKPIEGPAYESPEAALRRQQQEEFVARQEARTGATAPPVTTTPLQQVLGSLRAGPKGKKVPKEKKPKATLLPEYTEPAQTTTEPSTTTTESLVTTTEPPVTTTVPPVIETKPLPQPPVIETTSTRLKGKEPPKDLDDAGVTAALGDVGKELKTRVGLIYAKDQISTINRAHKALRYLAWYLRDTKQKLGEPGVVFEFVKAIKEPGGPFEQTPAMQASIIHGLGGIRYNLKLNPKTKALGSLLDEAEHQKAVPHKKVVTAAKSPTNELVAAVGRSFAEKVNKGVALAKRNLLLLRLQFEAGSRIGALLPTSVTPKGGLKVGDIDWENKSVKVYPGTKEEQVIPLDDEVFNMLKEHVGEGKKGTDFVFGSKGEPSQKGMSDASWWYNLNKEQKEAGVKRFSSHTIRSALANYLHHGQGMPAGKVAEVLGHTDAERKSIERYLRAAPHKYDKLHPFDPNFEAKRAQIDAEEAARITKEGPPRQGYGPPRGEIRPLKPGGEDKRPGPGDLRLSDPTLMRTYLFGERIYNTIKDKTKWAAAMVRQFGEKVRVHLDEWWNRLSNNYTAPKGYNKGGPVSPLWGGGTTGKPPTPAELAAQRAAEVERKKLLRKQGKPPVINPVPPVIRNVQSPTAPLSASRPEVNRTIDRLNEGKKVMADIEARSVENGGELTQLDALARVGATKKYEKKLVGRAQEHTPGADFAQNAAKIVAGVQNTTKAVDRAITPPVVIADWMDGGRARYNGWMTRHVVNPVDRMYNVALKLRDAMADPLIAIQKKYKLGQASAERISIFAHAQQEGGRESLKASGITDATIDRVVREGLSEGEAAWLQMFRDVVGSTSPEVARVLRDVYKRKLVLVNNYFPRQRDRYLFRPSIKGEKARELPGGEEVTEDILSQEAFEGRNISAATEHHFTDERVSHPKQPIKLDAFEVAERHLRDRSHFLAMDEIMHKTLSKIKTDTFAKAYGSGAQHWWAKWVDSTASQARNANRNFILDWLRKHSTIGAISWRLSSNVVHLANLPLAIYHIGEGNLAKGAEYLTRAAWEIGSGRASKFMRENFRESYERGGGEPSIAELAGSGKGRVGKFYYKAGKLGFAGARGIDQFITLATNLGIYMKKLEEKGIQGDSYASHPVDVDAQSAAMVRARRAVASPLPKDVPALLAQKGSWGRSLTQFQNVFLDQWSNFRHDFARAGFKKAYEKPNVENIGNIANLMLVGMGVMAIETGIKFGAKSLWQKFGGYESPEDETFWKKFEEELTRRVPFSGLVMAALTGWSDPTHPRVASGIPAVDALITPFITARQAAIAEGRRVPSRVARAATALGTTFGVPGASQMGEIAGNVYKGRMQRQTAEDIRRTGEELGFGPGAYNLKQRFQVAREISRKEEPETLEQHYRRAMQADQAQLVRRTEVTEKLPKEQQRWLKQRGLLVTGFLYTLNLKGESVQLTREEQEFYREHLQANLERGIDRLIGKGRFDALSKEGQKKLWSSVQSAAHTLARAKTMKLIQSRSKMEQHFPE